MANCSKSVPFAMRCKSRWQDLPLSFYHTPTVNASSFWQYLSNRRHFFYSAVEFFLSNAIFRGCANRSKGTHFEMAQFTFSPNVLFSECRRASSGFSGRAKQKGREKPKREEAETVGKHLRGAECAHPQRRRGFRVCCCGPLLFPAR